MSIKSDKWIRRMSEEFGMIDPFEPNQIKEANGQRIISYGTSSYGYDIRCANEFKIFTSCAGARSRPLGSPPRRHPSSSSPRDFYRAPGCPQA